MRLRIKTRLCCRNNEQLPCNHCGHVENFIFLDAWMVGNSIVSEVPYWGNPSCGPCETHTRLQRIMGEFAPDGFSQRN